MSQDFGTIPCQNNPFLPGGQGPTYALKPQPKLSLWALASLIVAVLAPVGICFCYPTLFGSALALGLGHVALYKIWKAQGELWGTALAVVAVIISYPMFFATLFMIVMAMVAGDQPTAPDHPGKAGLDFAESKVMSDSEGVAHGNSPEAQMIAEEFAADMKTLREGLFTESKSKLKLSGGNFVTYCHLTEDHCAFVVHAPDLRHFESDAKDSLADLAWTVAQSKVQDKLEDGKPLAVGLKGVIFYSSVITGKVGSLVPANTSKSDSDLYPFFAPEKGSTETEAMGSMTSETEEGSPEPDEP